MFDCLVRVLNEQGLKLCGRKVPARYKTGTLGRKLQAVQQL